jgi:hypothetical protein
MATSNINLLVDRPQFKDAQFKDVSFRLRRPIWSTNRNATVQRLAETATYETYAEAKTDPDAIANDTKYTWWQLFA